MGFPWQTGKARRQQEHDEDFARRAIMDHQLTMAGILQMQSEVKVLKPAKIRLRQFPTSIAAVRFSVAEESN